MEEESFTVMQNFESDELSLSSADLGTIIQVPTLEPFILDEENVLENINSLDVGEIHSDLLHNLDQMELHLECDDDRNYDMHSISMNKDTNLLPTSLVGNNVSLRISFANNHSIKQEKDSKNEFKCPICIDSFRIETKFRRHMLNLHQIVNPFQCKSCMYSASCRRLLVKHVNRRHIKSDKTEKLGINSSSQELTIDQVVCTSNQTLRKKSKNKTDDNTQIIAGMKVCNETDDSIFKCEECDYTCKQKRSLVLHAKRHTNEFDFQCAVCNKKFLSSVALKRHSKTHQETRPFVCQICGKGFKINGALTDHERYVHGKSKKDQVKRRSYDNTETESRSQNLKETESRSHDNGETRSRLQNLKEIESRSHDNNETESRSQNLKETEESPIINNKTEKTSNFKNKTERKFKCTFTGCEKLFRDSYNLITHLAIHSGMKGTTCPYCSFKCVQKTSLNWHLKSKHNK